MKNIKVGTINCIVQKPIKRKHLSVSDCHLWHVVHRFQFFKPHPRVCFRRLFCKNPPSKFHTNFPLYLITWSDLWIHRYLLRSSFPCAAGHVTEWRSGDDEERSGWGSGVGRETRRPSILYFANKRCRITGSQARIIRRTGDRNNTPFRSRM